jgi:lipopolysaccharide export system permease protein
VTGLLSRYVARSVIGGALLVLAVLVSLDSLFNFFGELDNLGEGDYGGWTAALYILLTVPGRTYELFPAAVAIGGVLGLGALAANSELVVMRAAGISIWRIMLMVMQGGVILMVILVAIGEGVAPASQQKAERLRAAAISGQGVSPGERGLWVRDEGRFINVGEILPGRVLRDVEIYTFDGTRLEQALHAERAVREDDEWTLNEIRRTGFAGGALSTARSDAERRTRLVRPELFQLLTVSPESLPAWQLHAYVNYLRSNDLEAGRFNLALWKKLEKPLSTLVMLLLALPVIFGSLRHTGTGQRVFIGSLIGIGYYLVAELFSHVGIVYGVAAPLAAMAPVVLFTVVGAVALRRTT